MNNMLTGDRIRLTEYKKEYIELAKEYINEPEVCLNLNPGIPFPVTLEEEKDWFEEQRKDDNTYNFAIVTNDPEEKYIGGCGIHDIDWKNSVAHIGIFIGHRNYRNNGYGTESISLLLDFVFNQTTLNKIMLEVFSFNKRAINSYKKNGFIEEGRLRENIFRNGEYHDEIIMGILRREYEKMKEEE